MGLWRSWITGKSDPVVTAALRADQGPGPSFSVDVDPGVLWGTLSAPDPWGYPGQRVSRVEAMAVPAVKRARDLICGAIGQLPLHLVGADGEIVDWSLFAQPESGTPRSVSMVRLAEDMLFESRSWLRVTHVGWHGKPAEVVRLDPTTVTVQPDSRVFYSRTGNGSALEWLPDEQLIRFDSPNDALLIAGARAIRALGRLEHAALNFADGVPPLDYFTPIEDADPLDDEEVIAFLASWKQARQARATAYVPAALRYNGNDGLDAEKLQLAAAREFAITEIARITGIDAEELSVSTTSRTYANMQDRRRQFLDFVLGPLMTAIEDRLSMPDVTPRGYRAKFDTQTFLRADDYTTAQTDVQLVAAGILTVDEAREKRNLGPAPARTEQPAADTEPTREAVGA